MYKIENLENKYKEHVNNQNKSIDDLKNNLLKNYHSISRDEIVLYEQISSIYSDLLIADIQLFNENLDGFENYEDWLVNGRFI